MIVVWQESHVPWRRTDLKRRRGNSGQWGHMGRDGAGVVTPVACVAGGGTLGQEVGVTSGAGEPEGVTAELAGVFTPEAGCAGVAGGLTSVSVEGVTGALAIAFTPKAGCARGEAKAFAGVCTSVGMVAEGGT